jgi:ABC-type bacteriocin/lantibiotic exporter with double-glycine peptidase domain
MKMSELYNNYPPELANRFFDVFNIQKGLSKLLLDFPAALLQIIFGLLLLSFYHPFFIVYGILLLLLIYVVFKFTIEKGLKTSLVESKSKYKMAHWIQEVARAIVSFKLSGRTRHALVKTDGLVEKYLDARESHFKVLVLQFIQMIGFKVLVTAGLLLIGGLLVLNQEMNIGQFVAAEIIILLVIASVEKLIMGLESFYDVLTSLEKLGQVVDKELEPQEGEESFGEEQELTIELNHVSFGVLETKAKIIDDVSFTITPSCSMLLQGSAGSGKTSLLRLIAGIAEPTEGDIYVNEVSLKGVNLNHYRSQLGQSLSEESPFEGTFLDNITFGDTSISREQIYWALEHTGLSKFIKEQPLGLNTVIYPEGKQISFTIAKKIVLARSIVRKPKLLMLQEPLDHLDESEANKIMDFLTLPEHKWALIIVSKNPRWAKRCERVLTLDNGKLISDIQNNA